MKLRWFAIIFLVLAFAAPVGYVAADKLGVLVNGSYVLDLGTGATGKGPFVVDGIGIGPLSAAPASPVDKATYSADRVNWNPASLSTVTKTASTIAMVSGSPATITDSGNGFVTAGFLPGQYLKVAGTLHNNGTYQLAGVAAGTLTLISGQSLTSESAGSSFTLTGGAPYTVLYSVNGNAGSAVYYALQDMLGNIYFITAHNISVPATCTTTNTGNAYSCTTVPSFTPVAGDQLNINFNVANTGAATLAVNGASALPIYKWGATSQLIANDLQANHWCRATMDSNGYWQLEGQLGNGGTVVNASTKISTTAPLGTALSLNGNPFVTGLTGWTDSGSGSVLI